MGVTTRSEFALRVVGLDEPIIRSYGGAYTSYGSALAELPDVQDQLSRYGFKNFELEIVSRTITVTKNETDWARHN